MQEHHNFPGGGAPGSTEAEELRALHDEAPWGYHSLDASGLIIAMNKTELDWLGYTREETIGKKRLVELMAPVSIDAFRANFIRLQRDGRIQNVPFDLVRKDGRILHTILNATLIKDEQGQFLRSYATLYDVTELKRAERALAERDAQYHGVLSIAGEGIITTDESGKIRSVNAALERLSQYTAKELIGANVSLLLPAARESVADAADWDPRETRARKKDGTMIPIHVAVSEINTGRERLYLTIVRDQTPLRQMEGELEWTKELFRLAVDSAEIGVWDFDVAENNLVWDDWMYRLYRVDRNEFTSNFEAWQRTVHPDDIEAAQDEFQKAIAGEKEFNTDFRVVWPGGEIRHLKAFARVVRNDAGQARHMVGVNYDITDLKEAAAIETALRRQVQRSNGELKDFAYVVSHDLKAPLRAIGSLTDWIHMDYAEQLGDKGREQLDLLKGRVQRMNQLIEGVLAYSRLGRDINKNTRIDTVELLNGILVGLEIDAGVEVQIASRLPALWADEIRIRQLFQNLIDNAIKHGGRPCRISIGFRGTGQNGEFFVRDDGAGIDPRFHEKVFQIFQTIDARDDVENTGIGLSIVKKIVEIYGGVVRLESAPGQGAAFFFTLPDGVAAK